MQFISALPGFEPGPLCMVAQNANHYYTTKTWCRGREIKIIKNQAILKKKGQNPPIIHISSAGIWTRVSLHGSPKCYLLHHENMLYWFGNNIIQIIAKGSIYNIWWQTLCTVQEFVIFSFQFPFFYKISPWKNSIILLLCKNVHLKWSHEEFSHVHWLLKFISFWSRGVPTLPIQLLHPCQQFPFGYTLQRLA